MRKLAELNIKEMFTAYKNYFAEGHAQYYCGNCNQQFAADWNIRANPMNSWIPRGSYVRCPQCGTLHDKYVGYGEKNEPIPFMLKISITALKKAVVLRVNFEATAFKKLFERQWCKGREIFRFDVEKGMSVFTKEIEFYEHGELQKERAVYPIDLRFAHAILRGSILRFFRPNSLAYKLHRSELTSVLRLIRETIIKMIAQEKKVQTGTLFINAPVYENGVLLLPLINIAYRIESPKALNLTNKTKFDDRIDNVYTFPMTPETAYKWATDIQSFIKEEKADLLSAMIVSAGLPNKTVIRKIVGNDYRSLANLKKALDLCQNYDLAIRVFHAGRLTEERINFFRSMLPIYGEERIARFAENAKDYRLDDCIRLYNQLDANNKQRLAKEGIRLRELHDWMSLAHKKQEHKNIPLNVPDYIINRLTMQAERLRFFIPKESMELLMAGHGLHNCVASYGQAMKEGSKWVVLVADDSGKLMACLAIEKNRLIEAKIDYNKAVKTNRDINKAVIEWAKTSKIVIDTQDIRIEDTEEKIA